METKSKKALLKLRDFDIILNWAPFRQKNLRLGADMHCGIWLHGSLHISHEYFMNVKITILFLGTPFMVQNKPGQEFQAKVSSFNPFKPQKSILVPCNLLKNALPLT